MSARSHSHRILVTESSEYEKGSLILAGSKFTAIAIERPARKSIYMLNL